MVCTPLPLANLKTVKCSELWLTEDWLNLSFTPLTTCELSYTHTNQYNSNIPSITAVHCIQLCSDYALVSVQLKNVLCNVSVSSGTSVLWAPVWSVTTSQLWWTSSGNSANAIRTSCRPSAKAQRSGSESASTSSDTTAGTAAHWNATTPSLDVSCCEVSPCAHTHVCRLDCVDNCHHLTLNPLLHFHCSPLPLFFPWSFLLILKCTVLRVYTS